MSDLIKLEKEYLVNVQHKKPDWGAVWYEVATRTSGITPDDSRLPAALRALDECDDHFSRGDWQGLQQAAERVRLVASPTND